MNEKESFNAESNIKNVIHTGHLSAMGGYLFCRDKEIMGWLFGSVRTRITERLRLKNFIETLKGIYQSYSMNVR